MKIDCSSCEMYRSDHCDDCLVTALLHPPQDIVDISEDLSPPLDALVGAGLIPVLKFRPRRTEPEEPAASAQDTEGPVADAG